ncbi:MAG: iron-sulfur cluster-binding domain-containing protein, partial [Deltaproteobacteria bacterium]|nr:iron-sulfur cluster-binding domain-containing protein [Deltaproteobacteria bacterium]
SGPAGNFYFNPLVHEKTMVCIAGGSGITPFMSMIREIAESGLDRTVYLFYGNKNTGDIIFHDELTELSKRFPRIMYTPVIEEPADDFAGECGFISGNMVSAIAGDYNNKTYFLCGPRGLYDFCLPELEGQGIPARRIRQEMFGPPTNIDDYPGWPSEITGKDVFTVAVKGKKSFQAQAGESLLTSLEKNQIVIPSLCRSGECSMCRVKVLSGTVFQPPGTMVRKSDRKWGYVHSCVSYPIEDLEILTVT